MKKSSRVVSTLLLGATVASASTGVFAVESKEIITSKLAGESRFETAVEVSNKFGEVDTVVLVNYTGIADALAATPLAKMKNAPILLTEAGSLTKATADQITKLKANNVIIIGGTTAVSENVVKQLKELGKNVERVAGEDRYLTSEAVAKEMEKDGKIEKVAVVNGVKGLADALSVAAPAAKEGMAIVLSDGNKIVAGEKIVNEAKTKYVIGGETVVTKELTEKLGAERLAGANRNATNAEVLNKFYDAKELDTVYVAKDGSVKENHLVDALAVGPLAGRQGNPVVLASSSLEKAQEAYLKDRIAKSLVEVGEGINQNTVSAIVKALTVKEETPSDKAEVTGVEVLNANQIEVKFNKSIDKDSAENIENYEIKADDGGADLLNVKNFTGKDEAKGKAIVGKAEVQDNEKTVVLTLPQAYMTEFTNNQQTIRVKVENVMTEDKSEVIEKYENKKVKLFDNTLPELKEIKQIGPKEVDLVFSEPVTAENNSAIVSATRIDNGKYSFTAKTRIDDDKIATNVVRLKASTELEDGTHTLTIKENKIMDYAGLKLEAVEKKFEAKENKEDFTASVYKTTADTVTLDFNKEVDEETATYADNNNVKYYLDYAKNKDYLASEAKMVDGKLQLKFDKEIPSGDHKIVVVYTSENKDKVTDLWENELATKEISFTVAKDTVAPKATVTYNKNDKKVEVKFSKEVNPDEAKNSANYELKDENGKYKNVSIEQKDKNNKLLYQIEAKDFSGKYTLKIKGDKIHDTSVERNAVKEETFELDTLDSKAPALTAINYGGDHKDKIYVEFSEEMRTEGEGSILDKDLYHIAYTDKDDKEQEKNLSEIEDAKIELDTNSSVIITLPNDGEAKDAKVSVGRVCDANGNFTQVSGITVPEKLEDLLKVGEVAKYDGDLVILKAKYLDKDDEILEDGTNANIVDENKVEVYVKGSVSSVDAKGITLEANGATYNCKEVKSKSVDLKVEEGTYVKATKLVMKFNDAKLNKGGITSMNLDLVKGAITTNLDTKSNVLSGEDKVLTVKDESDKSYIDVNEDTASIYTEIEKTKNGVEQNIAKKVEFELTKPVKGNVISKTTFEVEGYKVDKAEINGQIVTLTLDGTREANYDSDGDVSIFVEQKEPLYDAQDNKVDDLEFTIERITRMALFDKVNTTENESEMVKTLKEMKIELPEGKEDRVVAKVIKTRDAIEEVKDGEEVVVKGQEFATRVALEKAVEKAIDDVNAEDKATKEAEKAVAGLFADETKKSLAKDVNLEKVTEVETQVNKLIKSETKTSLLKDIEIAKKLATPELTITSIEKVKVVKDSKLPEQVTAVMSDNTKVLKNATWGEDVKTTEVSESKNVKVTVEGKQYDVQLEVTAPKATIKSIEKVKVVKGTKLPEQVTVVMSDDTKVLKNATWGEDVKTTEVSESKNVKVTVEGTEYDVQLEVTAE